MAKHFDTKTILKQQLAESTAQVAKTEKMLALSHQELSQLRGALENAAEGIARLDADGRYVSVNRSHADLHGYDTEELVGLKWDEMVAPEELQRLAGEYQRMLREGKIEVEMKARRRDGSTFYKQVTLVPIYGAKEEFRGHFAFVKNITDRKAAEAALRESEETFRQFTENIREVFWMVEIESGAVLYVSPAYEEVWGASRDTLYQDPLSWVEGVHEDDRETVRARWLEGAGKTGFDVEYRVVRPDGGERWIRDRAFPICNEDGEVYRIAGIAEDVTASKQLEEQLRRGGDSFANLINSCDVAMLVTDAEGVVQFVNHAAEALLGRSSDELTGEVFEPALEEGEQREMSISRDGAPAGTAELNLIRTDWDGKVCHLVIFHEITARKIAEDELKSYAERLKHSNQELQEFAFVASHDLQEPLRKIKAFGGRLHSKCAAELGEAGLDYLERMQSAAGRMETLITDLLTYSRITTKASPFVAVDLNKLVADVLQDLDFQVERTEGKVVVEDLPTIDADPTQMRQLFQNLVSNALKFRRTEEPPVVRVSGEPVESDDAEGLTFGEMYRIVISDNGIGFENKYQDRIFEVFQRLHGRGDYEGSGMGLAVCRKIVGRHGGTILAEGVPGEGSKFTVTLPGQQRAAPE